MKNSNKKAGNWGALKNKPQNQIYFKDGGKVKVTAGGEKHVIYKKTTKRGEGKVGSIMVNHPTKDKGVWDTIDLTKKSGAKTIKQGIASTRKWHKENPYNDMKKQVTKKQNGGIIANARKKSLINRYNKSSDKLKDAQARVRNIENYSDNAFFTNPENILGPNPVRYTAGNTRQNAKINKADDRIAEKVKSTNKLIDDYNNAKTGNEQEDMEIKNFSQKYKNQEDKQKINKKAGKVRNRVEKRVGNKWDRNEKRVEKIDKKLDKIDSKMKRGGSVKKYQTGGKVTPPTGKNALKTGVYRGTKLTPAQIKQSQEDWKKKERAATNPANKPAGSPMRKLQKGGPSYIDKVKAVGPAIQKNTKTTDTFNRAERKEFMDQFSMDRLSSKDINYLNRKPTRVSGRAGSPYEKMSNEGMSVQEALRLAAKKGEQKKKFTPANKFTPPKASSPKVVKQSLYKPLYKNNKKTGGAIKKKK